MIICFILAITQGLVIFICRVILVWQVIFVGLRVVGLVIIAFVLVADTPASSADEPGPVRGKICST